MGWSVSEKSQPARKRLTLEKRLRRLRGAVKAGEDAAHLNKAAEKVREASLALIKATRALIVEYPQRDPDGRQSQKLQREEQHWSLISPEAIIDDYGHSGA